MGNSCGTPLCHIVKMWTLNAQLHLKHVCWGSGKPYLPHLLYMKGTMVLTNHNSSSHSYGRCPWDSFGPSRYFTPLANFVNYGSQSCRSMTMSFRPHGSFVTPLRLTSLRSMAATATSLRRLCHEDFDVCSRWTRFMESVSTAKPTLPGYNVFSIDGDLC